MKKRLLMLLPVAVLTATFSGCSSEPEWVGVYEDCKERVNVAAEEMKKENEDGAQHPMAEAMGNMAVSMGMAACESIKQACEDDPDGDVCQAVVAEAKKAEQEKE